VEVLLENGLLLNMFELGLKIHQAGGVAAAVGAAASMDKIEAFVLDLLAINAPIFMVSSGLIVQDDIRSWEYTDQPPLPAPFFLIFFGSASTGPDLAK
jgi:hypothetical protein